MSYIDTLINNCKKAQLAKPSPSSDFVLNKPSDLDGIEKAIYIIEEINGDTANTFIEFCKYKQRKERACPKPNAPSQVMYVGSSTTGVKKRIEQHQGNGPKDTYALNLAHWFNGNYKITIKVYDEPAEVLQILEDALSHDLSPAFGKRGGNNK